MHASTGTKLVAAVSWAGVRFDATIYPDDEEIRRRDEAGLGAVTDHLTLKLLSTLPTYHRVSWQALDPVRAAFIDCLSSSLVSTNSEGVKRLLAPALTIHTLIKPAEHWRAVGRVAPLAQDARTTVLLQHKPRELDRAIGYARKFGIGLDCIQKGIVTHLVRPGPPSHWGVRSLRLSEIVYAQWCRQTAGTPAKRSHAFSCFDGCCKSSA